MSCEKKPYVVTYDDLAKCNISSDQINAFISCGIIHYISENTFTINSIDSLIWSKDCQKLMPIIINYLSENDVELTNIFNHFLNSILSDDYATCFVYLDVLLAVPNSKYKDIINYYLYLLCVINDSLPKKYYDYMTQVSKKVPGIYNNQIFSMIFDHKFTGAYQIICDKMAYQSSDRLDDKALLYLLSQAIVTEKIDKNHVIELIDNNQYIEVAKFYMRKSQHYRLSNVGSYIVKLCDMLRIISTYRITPKISKKDGKNIFDAINYNDFSLAYSYAQQYLRVNNCDESKDILYMLLGKINDLIGEIKNNCQEPMELDYNGLTAIRNRIEAKDFKKACDYLHPYLEKNNQLSSENIVKDLIREYVINNKGTLSEIMTYIVNLVTNQIEFASLEEILNFVPDNFDIPEDTPYINCKRSA